MHDPRDTESILYAFAIEPTHDRATLERYLALYPELAAELVDLSAEIRQSEALGPEETAAVADPGAAAALAEFLACKPQPAPAASGANPVARYKGAAFVTLAESVKVPRSILTSLRDGLVVPSSIPSAVLRRLGEATGESIERLRSSLAEVRQAPAGLAFKSDVKPSHQGQKTFRSLVESTAMADEMRLLLLRECDEDGLD